MYLDEEEGEEENERTAANYILLLYWLLCTIFIREIQMNEWII